MTDAFGSFSGSASQIVVKPSKLSSDALLTALMTSFKSESPRFIRNTIASVTSMISSIDCTSSPNCQNLHRDKCYRSTGTCGPCLAGFSGVLGDSNTMCTSSTGPVVFGSTCVDSQSCNALETCQKESGLCIVSNQTCVNDCSGRGRCLFIDNHSGNSISSCAANSVFCSAVCACTLSFSGDHCQHSKDLLLAGVAVTNEVLQSIVQLTSIAVPTLQAVKDIESIVSLLPSESSFFSTESQETLVEIISYIVDFANSLPYSFGSSNGLLQAIGVLSHTESSSTSRRLLQSNNTIQKMFTSIGQLYAHDMIRGQKTVSYIDSIAQIRYVFASPGKCADYSMEAPLTEEELGIGVIASRLTFVSLKEESKVSAIFYSAVGSNMPPVFSNVLIIQVGDVAQTCGEGCKLLLVLQHDRKLDFQATLRYVAFYM